MGNNKLRKWKEEGEIKREGEEYDNMNKRKLCSNTANIMGTFFKMQVH